MKVLFVYTGAENLGVEYLAAVARAAGHEVDLAFDPAVFGGKLMWDVPSLATRFDLRPKIIRRILAERPDVVAFSCISGNYLWALSMADEVKKSAPGIRTIFGGVHVSAVPDRVIAEPAVDAVALGEAEAVFVRMLEMRGDGSEGDPPPGVWEKRGGGIARGPAPVIITDPDTIPFPAKDLFYRRAPAFQSHYMIMTDRRCPYNCTYCYKSLSVYSTPGIKPVRRRSVRNVMSELEEAVSRWKVRMVVFRDDVFTLNRKWLEEFAAEYRKRIGLKYFCYTHPAAVDERGADLIKESGCVFVSLGIQSADDQQRRNILNRRYTNDQVRRTVSLLKRHGITVSVDHIIGIPGDTVEGLLDAARFYNELRPDRLLTFWLTYYPGTEIMRIALDKGVITESDRDRIESGDVGHRYSGGGAVGIKRDMLRLPGLFALIPLLSSGMIKKLLSRGFWRFLPASFAFHNILLFLNAVRIRDPFFIYNIKFFFSRKRVP